MRYTNYSLKQKGFSLVELIIAIGLSAALMFGVLQIFDANKQSTRMQHAMVEVQEGGRIATELMARDIRMADFWGCMNTSSNVTNHIDMSTAPDLDYANSSAVSGDFDVDDGTFIQQTTGDTPSATKYTLVAGSDTLTLRGAYTVADVRLSRTDVPTSANIKLENIDTTYIARGTPLLITDCTQADLFVVSTKDTVGGGNSDVKIMHNTGDGGDHAKNATKKFDDENPYGTDAQIYHVKTRKYFVGRVAGATVDSLYMQDDGGVPSEMIRNVSGLEFTYGIDSDDDGVVNLFSEAPTAAQLEQALSVRTVITTHSKNKVASGSVLSRDFTMTANIRNRSI